MQILHKLRITEKPINIDRRAVDEYLSLTGQSRLSEAVFEVTEIEDRFPVERITKLLNESLI